MSRVFPYSARSTADEVVAGIDLTRKRFLVTGCNSGIGFHTMSALVANGAQVIGLARTLESAQAACKMVGPSAIPLACDLSNLVSVSAAADAVRCLPGQLDAIITNASVGYLPALQTRHNVELHFLVDYLAHFLFVNCLADRVRNNTGRIVIVSSKASLTQAPVEGVMFDNLDGRRFYHPATFFGQAKFAAALYAKELSRRLASRGVSVNSLHPGDSRGTGFSKHRPFIQRWVHPIVGLFQKSAAQGASTQTMLAANPHVVGISGEYWADCQIARGNPLLADAELAQRLWNTSVHLIAKLTSADVGAPARFDRQSNGASHVAQHSLNVNLEWQP